MKERRFGVEIEFSSNGNRNLGIGKALADAGYTNWVGEPIECNGGYWDGSVNQYEYYPRIGSDGSDLELRSPILQGRSGFKELFDVVKVLNELECYATESDGLHIHHDAPEFVNDKDAITKLLKSWINNQNNISLFIEPDRRNRPHGPCRTINHSDIDKFETDHLDIDLGRQIANNLPRGNLNCRSLYEHGTVEFRYHEGTLDYDEIESWIQFGQSFLNGVVSRKHPLRKTDNPITMMNRLKTSRKARANLINKAAFHGYSLTGQGVQYA